MTDTNAGGDAGPNGAGTGDATPLPRTCTNQTGRTRAISDAVLMDGINIVGDEQANRETMLGGILEDFLDREGQIAIVADDNQYAGLAEAAPNGVAYDVVTLGQGNPGAEILSTDGELIADLILTLGASVTTSLAGFTPQQTTNFLRDYAERMAVLTPREVPMLVGFAALDQHLPRQRMGGDSQAVRNAHFMNGRLRRNNVGMANVLSALREAPQEFDENITNTIIMLQVRESHQKAVAKRVGRPHTARIMGNVQELDCGLSYQGLNHGTLFNPSDRDPAGPYVIVNRRLKSMVGPNPTGRRELNAVTLSFMDDLVAARAERERARRAAIEETALQAALQIEMRFRARRKARIMLDGGKTARRTVDGVRQKTGRGTTQAPFAGRSLHAAVQARGHRMASKGISAALALLENRAIPGNSIDTMTFDQVVDFIMLPATMENLRRAGNTCTRVRVHSVSGFALAHALLDHHGEQADAFFAAMGAKDAGSPDIAPQRLVAKLRRMSAAERTPTRVADFALQAWNAHLEGRTVRCFRDSAVPLVPSNDNGLKQDKAA